MLSALDQIILIGYLVATLAIGFWSARKAKGSSREFFVTEKALPWWVVGLTMVAAGISAEQMLGEVGYGMDVGLVVSNYLCNSYPGGTEGELSRMKHRLVSAPTLAKASQALNLGDFLRFGRGEEKSGGRQKNALLADVFEAITGAIFLDGGLEAATRFVCHALRDELEGADPLSAAKADYKTMLQERLQASRRPAPRYAVIETLGPPHQRIFHVEVSWDGGSIQGEGHSIKAAEAAAARAALEGMKLDESENGDESSDDPCSST